MSQNNDRRNGLIAILAANTIFGLNIPVTRELMDGWMTPLGYTTTRMFFGAIVFSIIGLFGKKERIEAKDFLPLFFGGIIGFLGTQLLFSQALLFTSPIKFSLLMSLTPVIVLVLSAIFLKEKIIQRKVIGIILSIGGAALIILSGANSSGESSNDLLGIAISITCALLYSIYMVLTRKISVKYRPETIAKWMLLFSAIVVLPFGFQEATEQEVFSTGGLEGYLLLNFALWFSTVIAFFLMPFGLKRLEASTVSVFMNLQPFIAATVAILAGQDFISVQKLGAGVLVLVGVYLVTKKKKSQTIEKAQ